jgi:hypothetical protein
MWCIISIEIGVCFPDMEGDEDMEEETKPRRAAPRDSMHRGHFQN